MNPGIVSRVGSSVDRDIAEPCLRLASFSLVIKNGPIDGRSGY